MSIAFFACGHDAPDADSLVTTRSNRWSDEGARTVYLACDLAVALAEAGRHLDEVAADGRFGIWEVRYRLVTPVDLRASLVDGSDWASSRTRVLDEAQTRPIAARHRASGDVDGLLVPSAAFLDDPARWNAVLFLAPDESASSRLEVLRLAARVEVC